MVEEVLEYLRECGVFFVATATGSVPHVRPFEMVCGFEGHLYVMTSREKNVYLELTGNPRVEIAAVHPDKSWIRITGELVEDHRPEVKAAMVENNKETLSGLYEADDERIAVFRLTRGKAAVKEMIGTRQEWVLP